MNERVNSMEQPGSDRAKTVNNEKGKGLAGEERLICTATLGSVLFLYVST